MAFRKMLPFASLTLLLVSLLAAVPAAEAKYKVGVGEQDSAMFSSARWQSLKLKRSRYLVPWNWTANAATRAAVTTYMTRARAARQQVLVSFTAAGGCYNGRRYSKKKACRAPSAAKYRASFRAFDDQFPWVRTYSAWNEVNHVSQPTYRKPKLAVRYYNVLRREARARKFRVMAADVLDTSNLRRYLRAFLRRAKGSPRLWGLHNYQDVNYRTSSDTRRMLSLVRGEVWLTETGGIVRFAGSRLRKYSPKRAAARTKYMFRLAKAYSRHRAGTHAKITQLFVYTWFGEPRGARFDAGLVNPNGTPRRAFSVVRRGVRGHR